jgi:hypothetical protein
MTFLAFTLILSKKPLDCSWVWSSLSSAVRLLDLLVELEELVEHGAVVGAVGELAEEGEGAGAELHEPRLALAEDLVAAGAGLVDLLGERLDLPGEGPDALDVGPGRRRWTPEVAAGVEVLGQLLGAGPRRGDGRGPRPISTHSAVIWCSSRRKSASRCSISFRRASMSLGFLSSIRAGFRRAPASYRSRLARGEQGINRGHVAGPVLTSIC